MTTKLSTLLMLTTAPLLIASAVSAQDVIKLQAGANTEPSSGVVSSGDGFEISIEGSSPSATANSNRPSSARRADMALARADLRVTFDGLSVKPRLDLKVLNDAPVAQGDTLNVQSQMNYPAFVQRGEVRVMDLTVPGRPRTVLVVPVEPNGAASFTVPTMADGTVLAMTHRVYDASGRYDETAPQTLTTDADIEFAGDRIPDVVEEGTSTLSRQRIPIFGGAVTVAGSSVPAGAKVETLGEVITPDPTGSFVLQRILPPGDQPVAVQVRGAGPGTYVERNVTIPRNEWFYTGTADLTYGWRNGSPVNASGDPLEKTYSYGRLAGYAKGRTSSGWTITASADTNEEDLDDLLRNFDEKDANDVLLRAARENAYPTFGDDSTIEDGAPTNGKFYLRAEKGGNHVMWGNYKATVSGSKYLRNERELYGFQGVYRTQNTTTRGDARASVEVYGALPDRLPGRENFRGTGGSIYFLQRQDVAVGSETLSIEIRDRTTGRVVETRILTEGRDYDVNYIQGVITLAQPLSGQGNDGSLISQPGGDTDVFLVANYEFTPTTGDVDGSAFGGRVESWVTNDLRFGATVLAERTDIADQTALGADLRYAIGDNSYVALEYAETEGPGFGSSTSSDGGLIITSTTTAGIEDNSGRAYSAEVVVDLADLGSTTPGSLTAYFENRTAGFSTLDYQTRDDEELWGLALDVQATDRLALRLSYDDYSNDTGKVAREGEASVTYRASERATWAVGIAHLEKSTPGGLAKETGKRTDVALRYTHKVREDLTWYLFGQKTIERSGGLVENDRVGAGVSYRFARNWTFDGELSEGSTGTGGEALLTYQAEGYDKTYVGYRLNPGRDFTGVTLNGNDRGTWVVGGQRQVSDNVEIFGENTYDLFGSHKSLTSAYGAQYRTTEKLTFSGAFEYGQVQDGPDDFDRKALSLGVRYADKDRLTASAKLELRRDEGAIAGSNRDQDAVFFTAAARYKINDNQRLIFGLEYADTETDNTSILSGTYGDVTLGYAYRPVLNDKLNVLFKYRYLYDMIGQEIDGSSVRGPRQESHVLSVDMAYDLSPNWTLGAKVGGRWSVSSPNEAAAFQDNDAWLAVVNARYHLTHKWDGLVEARYLEATDAGFAETGVLAAAYRHVGNNVKFGVGYNFGRFSDDLTDLTLDDKGLFINLIAKF